MTTTETTASNIEAMKAQYLKAKDAYYNSGKNVMSDAEFDALEERLEKIDPALVSGTGILGKKAPVALQRYMPSLDKCKAGSDDKLKNFVRRLELFNDAAGTDRFVVMEKLDGASVLATYVKGKLTQLATRGDGVTGKDITFLAPYCRNLPKEVSTATLGSVAFVRMEAILPLEKYEKKYAEEADSARAAVSGALNRRAPSKMLKHIKFVALRLLDNGVTMRQGLKLLRKEGFDVVNDFGGTKEVLTNKKLSLILKHAKKKSEYEMDGLVVHSDCRELSRTEGKPGFAFAWKKDISDDEAPLTTIREIKWKVSAFGIAVPKAIIDPVKFGQVTVKQVALHNFKWAAEKGCGVGARVRVIRSGDIIPKIVKVEKPKTLDRPKGLGALKFDGTNFVLVAEEITDGGGGNSAHYDQVLQRFFSVTGLDGFGLKLAAKLAENGVRTEQLVSMVDPDDWEDYAGAGVAAKLAKEIQRFRKTATFPVVMAASGVFGKGLGKTRVQSYIDANGVEYLTLRTLKALAANVESAKEAAARTPGCGPAFAETLAKGLPEWFVWLDTSGLVLSGPKTVKQTSGLPMSGMRVSFTGYRSKEEEESLVALGASIVPFGGKTDVLLHRPDGKQSTKVEKATSSGILVMLYTALYKKYSKKA